LSGKIIKIADFGCAKLVEFMNTYRYTSNSFNIGTPMYSAPEILNMEAYDERCDVWSVGVILYFMVYETVPFLERNIHLLKSIITERTRGNNLTLPNFP
jgi:serine/threonine protein kinase